MEKNSKIKIEREIDDMAVYGLSPETVRSAHLEHSGLFLSPRQSQDCGEFTHEGTLLRGNRAS